MRINLKKYFIFILMGLAILTPCPAPAYVSDDLDFVPAGDARQLSRELAHMVYFYLNDSPVEVIEKPNKSLTQLFAKNIITNGTFLVNLKLKKEQNVSITLFSSDGRVVKSKEAGSLSAGEHKIQINMEVLPMGVYFIHYTIDNKSFKQKVVFVK